VGLQLRTFKIRLPQFCNFQLLLIFSVCLSAHLPACLLAYMSVCPPIYLSVWLSVNLSVCMFAYLSVCLSPCLPACLLVCPPVSLSATLLPGYRYKVANFIVAMLQSCYVQTCYVTNLLRFKLATGQTCYGVKLATGSNLLRTKLLLYLTVTNLLRSNLILNINVTKLLWPNLLPREQRYKVAT
jgi:hypothetical protein